jgi:hypothetical protein
MSVISSGPNLTLPAESSPAARAAGWVGLVLHGVAALPFLFSGLVAPPWGVAVLWVVWVALLAVALRVRVVAPWWTLAVGPGAVAVLIAVVSLGDAVLGWTA